MQYQNHSDCYRQHKKEALLAMRGRLTPIELDNYKPLRDIVFETLREAIIARVALGERLMECGLPKSGCKVRLSEAMRS